MRVAAGMLVGQCRKWELKERVLHSFCRWAVMAAPMLARTRILKRINAALEHGDVYLSAPAGYGKSTLLRLLLGHRPAITLLALSPSDADLSQLQARLQPHLPHSRTVVLDDVQYLTGTTEALT